MNNEDIIDAMVEGLRSLEWQGVCENMFRFLARKKPEELINHLSNKKYSYGLRARCAYAVEECKDANFARSLLIPFLEEHHKHNPIFIEGIVYGLSHHFNNEIRDLYVQIVDDKNTNQSVREMLEEELNIQYEYKQHDEFKEPTVK